MRLQAFPPAFAVYSVFPVVFCSVEVHLGASGLFLLKWHGLRYVLLRLQEQGCCFHLYRRFQAALYGDNASYGAPPILSRKQWNPVVCKLNRFIQHRVLHDPYHRIDIDTEIFMDFCPSTRRIPIDGFLFVLGVSCLNISHWNERVSVPAACLSFAVSVHRTALKNLRWCVLPDGFPGWFPVRADLLAIAALLQTPF